MNRYALPALLTATALVLAGCGGDEAMTPTEKFVADMKSEGVVPDVMGEDLALEAGEAVCTLADEDVPPSQSMLTMMSGGLDEESTTAITVAAVAFLCPEHMQA